MQNQNQLSTDLQTLQKRLQAEKILEHRRRVSFGDLIADRWEIAEAYGFGKGSSCYDNVLIIGEVKVGKNTWIGPNVILDGSGGLEIGDYCSISAGVQIYTHHTIAWANSMGQEPTEKAPVRIGSGVYIGPNSVIQMGVCVGDKATIGAMSFVNRPVATDAKVWGTPAREQG